jgi:hypothetical protein
MPQKSVVITNVRRMNNNKKGRMAIRQNQSMPLATRVECCCRYICRCTALSRARSRSRLSRDGIIDMATAWCAVTVTVTSVSAVSSGTGTGGTGTGGTGGGGSTGAVVVVVLVVLVVVVEGMVNSNRMEGW